jgi:hypothetical protein
VNIFENGNNENVESAVHEPVHEPVAVFLRPARCTAFLFLSVWSCGSRVSPLSQRNLNILIPALIIVCSCNTIDLLFFWDQLGLVSDYIYHPWTSLHLLRCWRHHQNSTECSHTKESLLTLTSFVSSYLLENPTPRRTPRTLASCDT